jgi:hypothetical protein
LFIVASGAGATVIVDGVEVAHGVTAPIENVIVKHTMLNVFINFDDVVAPCSFSQQNPLRNEYQALGVVFEGPAPLDGGAILDECGNFGVNGHSSPNFLAFNCNAGMANGGTPRSPETLIFTDPVAEVSLLAGSGSGAGQPLTAEAFDVNMDPLGSQTITLATTLQPVGVVAPGIKYLVVSGPCVFVLDDLTFELGATPVESSTWGGIKALYE